MDLICDLINGVAVLLAETPFCLNKQNERNPESLSSDIAVGKYCIPDIILSRFYYDYTFVEILVCVCSP